MKPKSITSSRTVRVGTAYMGAGFFGGRASGI